MGEGNGRSELYNGQGKQDQGYIIDRGPGRSVLCNRKEYYIYNGQGDMGDQGYIIDGGTGRSGHYNGQRKLVGQVYIPDGGTGWFGLYNGQGELVDQS